MIKGFEEYTSELTEYEKKHILPFLIDVLRGCKGKERSVFNHSLVKRCKELGYKTSEPRVRHMIHVIRVSGIVPFLVATSGGYYVATEMKQLDDYQRSLSDRIRHIEKIRYTILHQMTFFGYPEGDDEFPESLKDALVRK